ncbi:hypothetical protein GCM10010969_16670 [Saccharibacillus kuerlensis]|uniref:Uncharacterized protein n=1 Tax=Saccharibacillus kuerlensis TaxID=459527 RepID=A0ABQ2KZP7_9BACL|nr:hypothetical protein GCM10010969_16670 [Saccharibacillus kuerlensis]
MAAARPIPAPAPVTTDTFPCILGELDMVDTPSIEFEYSYPFNKGQIMFKWKDVGRGWE